MKVASFARDRHSRRLLNSAELLDMRIPYIIEQLDAAKSQILELVTSVGRPDAAQLLSECETTHLLTSSKLDSKAPPRAGFF